MIIIENLIEYLKNDKFVPKSFGKENEIKILLQEKRQFGRKCVCNSSYASTSAR